MAAGRATADELRQEVGELYEHYKRLYAYIELCRGSVRQNLGENAYRTKNALVALRTMLEI
jgi:hypothetical protein